MARKSISFKTSIEGAKLAEGVLHDRKLKLEDLEDPIGCCAQPIKKFFTGGPVKKSIFLDICDYLGLEWRSIVVSDDELDKKALLNESMKSGMAQPLSPCSVGIQAGPVWINSVTLNNNTPDTFPRGKEGLDKKPPLLLRCKYTKTAH
jgi:DNA-binding Xre family transcriptional regulator